MRFLLYSHDGLGLGHTSRNMAIAKGLARFAPDSSILLATSADEVLRADLLPQVEIFKLPGLRKVANGHYVARRLPFCAKGTHKLRSKLLTSVIEGYRPDVLLVDKHPFGAGGELREGLEWHRGLGGRTALGFRDILDDPETVLAEWAPHGIAERIASYYDRVLIYGEALVFDPTTAYRLPPTVRERTRFCGYVVNEAKSGQEGMLERGSPNRRRVLATVGGGEDGEFLLESFLRASRGTDWQAEVVTGPMLQSSELARLSRLAAEVDATLHQHVPNLRARFRQVDAVVCMGGYNTLAETVAAGARVLCVPRVHPRREQLIRAEAFERLGVLRCVHPGEVTPGRLRAEIAALMSQPQAPFPNGSCPLSMDGSHSVAVELCQLASSAWRESVGATDGESGNSHTWQI